MTVNTVLTTWDLSDVRAIFASVYGDRDGRSLWSAAARTPLSQLCRLEPPSVSSVVRRMGAPKAVPGDRTPEAPSYRFQYIQSKSDLIRFRIKNGAQNTGSADEPSISAKLSCKQFKIEGASCI